MKSVAKLTISDPTIIRMLEEALKCAQKGGMISCAVAWTTNDAYTGSVFYAPDRVMALLGELTVLNRDIMDLCVESRKDENG